jgi:hypothetical protein
MHVNQIHPLRRAADLRNRVHGAKAHCRVWEYVQFANIHYFFEHVFRIAGLRCKPLDLPSCLLGALKANLTPAAPSNTVLVGFSPDILEA